MATFPVKQNDYFDNQRSNSISSGSNHSMNSTSNISTMSTSSRAVPRGSSTTDLLYMESKFAKPSRSKPQFRAYQNQGSSTSLTGYNLPGRIPRSSSVPSVPKLIPENPPERPALPTHLHPGLKSSISMHHIPAYRRQSLKTASEYNRSSLSMQQPFPSAHQNQQPLRQPLQQPPYKRRHSARPAFHNAPFTFPNGEVYTPRNKQRNPQPNTKALPHIQNNRGIPRNSSSPSLTSQHQQQFQSFGQHHHQQQQQPRQQQQPQLLKPKQAPPPLPSQNSIVSQEKPGTAADQNGHRSDNHSHTEQDFALLTTGSNSFSSSPSPSRTSRTNSSVNESTPPSSIDDLTLHTANINISNNNGGKPELSQLPPPLQQLDSTGNLGKIEEHDTKSSTPTSDSTQSQRTLEAVNGDKKEDPREPDHAFLDEQAKARSKAQSAQFEANKSTKPAAPVISIPQVPQQKTFPTIAKPQVSTVNASSSFHTQSKPEPAPQRKQSVLKRIFSKVFTSSDKKKSTSKFSLKKKSSQATLNVKSTFRPELPIRSKTEPEKPYQTPVKAENPPPLPKLTTSDDVKDIKLTTEPDTSDVFSFMDGDEDEGIKVESEESSTKELRTELVLDKLFSKLSTNESSEEVFKKINNGEKRTSQVLDDVDVTGKGQNTIQPLENKKIRADKGVKSNATVAKPQDPEDYVIQFDDLEFIDKIIEFGETPFPDLKSSDLGQSERKLQRTRSIERKKSIRSISSSSGRQLDEVMASAEKILPSKQDTRDIQVIYSNQPKDPFPMIESRPSILKKRKQNVQGHYLSNSNGSNGSNGSNKSSSSLSSTSATSSNKKVGFTNQIFVNNTYPSYIYNRHSRSLSSYSLSPQLIQQIRHEMNDFKRSMTIHESSRGNTHYFRA